MHEGQETIITLTMLKNETEERVETLLKRIRMDEERKISPSNLTVHLPQLSLSTFDGDPRKWRQFWNSFDATIHSQTIPEIQKLNYLHSSLKRNALQAVSRYEIAPENYETIRRLLKTKYGDSSTISTILYKELQAIRGNEKNWMAIIENVERVLCQLEALGDNLEHLSIETTMENKLPSWVLNKIYAQKKLDRPWSILKLLVNLKTAIKVKHVKRPKDASTAKLQITVPYVEKEAYQLQTTWRIQEIKNRVQLNVRTTDKGIITLRADVIEHLTNKLQVVEVPREPRFNDLTNYWEKPDTLIGADYFFKFINLQDIKELHSGHTRGSGDINELCKHNGYSAEIIYSVNVNLNSELKKFWKLEMIGIHESPLADDDDRAIKHFEQTITSLKQMGDINNNYGLCIGRLENLVKRLQLRSLLHLYDTIIKDQLQIGIIEEVPPNDEAGIIHYLPHHEVLTPSKTTTKLRIVYDASARQKGLKSLNEVLYRGPVILPHLVGVLLRFRSMKIVITADIEKAFLQIGLQEDERNCTRFLWLKDINKEVSSENLNCYRFQRVPFGVVSSPFLLAPTLNHHLENCRSELAEEIRRNLYVDNITISANGTQDALYKYEQMKKIFKEASMNVREFLSNNKFNKQISRNDLNQTKKENFLGLNWNHQGDHINVTLKPWKGKVWTKRSILQFIASQYDPLGFIVPVLIRFKLFIQDLWREEISWDQPLNEANKQKWRKLISEWPTKVTKFFKSDRISHIYGCFQNGLFCCCLHTDNSTGRMVKVILDLS
uniref:DUF1758 domain-containing protein n=1 Tax=Loa loa TaxID=7209 RepID=A0A1I7VRE3_LOALO